MQKLIRNSGVRDHPHAYGDKYSLAFPGFPELGSSPRVWGQAVRQAQSCHMNRIIPTRMGTSSFMERTVCSQRGSSPRVWGQVFTNLEDGSVAGIIPTRMGTRHQWRYERRNKAGSSPRVWGQVFTDCCNAVYKGIIPTRMGTSPRQIQTSEFGADHPHAYGDKALPVVPSISPYESSPRVWGQVRTSINLFDNIRIIPTRMGTRLSERLRCEGFGDHPHAYGDKVYHNYHLHEE